MGNSSNDMKMPLMNSRGNFTSVAIILDIIGKLKEGIANKLPREAKQNAPRIIARVRMRGLDIVPPKASVIIMGTSELTRPKIKEARISPIMIVLVHTGQHIRRSSVLVIVSHGTTMGDIAVAVKKRIMPNNPGIMNSILRSRPMIKAKNINPGKSKPKINTGPLE